MVLSGDGNTVAIGAPYHDGNNSTVNGTDEGENQNEGEGEILQNIDSVSMFRYNETERKWRPLGKSWWEASHMNHLEAISQDGNIVAVGMSELFRAEQYVTAYEYRYDGIDSTNSNSTWVQLGNEIWSDRRFKKFLRDGSVAFK
mmetsp:Transcript_1916/g.2939  ORF Transcript_1916/g.2939 Transcript_1916/m.2939 type:complete len:144 (+) Transcript_1916:371-802(+)